MIDPIMLIRGKIVQAHNFLEGEYGKIFKLATDELQKIIEEANLYQRKISEMKSDWGKIDNEIKTLLEKKEMLMEKEIDIESRLASVVEREGQIAAMVKIQTNRQNMLDEKEKELKIKERRSL